MQVINKVMYLVYVFALNKEVIRQVNIPFERELTSEEALDILKNITVDTRGAWVYETKTIEERVAA
jgi:hypothetical protein